METGKSKQYSNRRAFRKGIDIWKAKSGGRQSQNHTRAEEVGSFARGLKELAKEIDKPVLAAAQLNRAVESRHDKRPTLADLRESGDIEQSADVVIGIHREDYYEDPDKRNPFSHTEFVVLKNRDGETGIAHAGFFGEYKRFVTAQYSEEHGTWQYSTK